MIISLLLITLAGTFPSCIARRTGAPKQACSNLLPQHGDFKPQQGSSPYIVSAKSLGNNKISVKISSSNGETFEGFILQARSASNREKFIPGEFSIDSISKGVNCEEHEKGTLTHVNNEPKTEVATEWTGPLDEGIIFRATVVKEFTAFWINIDSDPVTVEKKELDIKNPSNNPENCIDNGKCKVILEFHDMGYETIQFTLTGVLEESQYMAMGISEDNRMGDDFVTACLRDSSGKVRLQKSWNEGRHNIDTIDATANHLEMENGITTCTWIEEKDLNFNGKTYDYTNKPYILLAQGQVEKGNLVYHDSRLASSEPVDLFMNGTLSLVEQGGDTKQATGQPGERTTGKPGGHQTTETSSKIKSTVQPNSSSQLNFGLFWLAFLGVFYASRRNFLNLI